jgi:hypothetical protein
MTLSRVRSRLLAVLVGLLLALAGGTGWRLDEQSSSSCGYDTGFLALCPGDLVLASTLGPAIIVLRRRSRHEERQRQSQPWAGPPAPAGPALLPAGVTLRLPALLPRAPRAEVAPRRRGLGARLSRLLRRS